MDYNIDNVPETLNPGDRVLCPYSGTVKALPLPKGRYKLECWGAKGGDSLADYTGLGPKIGGDGGYSVGTYALNSMATLFLCCGEAGQSLIRVFDRPTLKSAYNGGGKSGWIDVISIYGLAAGGGGATHIALRSGLLKDLSGYIPNILMVAGGGGGAYTRGYLSRHNGGHGGGLSGGVGSHDDDISDSRMLPGTQDTAGQRAGFGFGADSGGDTTQAYRGGGGGSGFYGGSAGYSNVSAGSAGSGYVANTLLDGNTFRSDESGYVQNPDSNQNGYIIITVLGMLYSAAYNGETLFTAYTGDNSVSVVYGDEIASVGKGQSKTLLTKNKATLTNIHIGDKTLNCAGKYFVDDVVVTGHNS